MESDLTGRPRQGAHCIQAVQKQLDSIAPGGQVLRTRKPGAVWGGRCQLVGGERGHPEKTEEWDSAVPGVGGGKPMGGRGEKLREEQKSGA